MFIKKIAFKVVAFCGLFFTLQTQAQAVNAGGLVPKENAEYGRLAQQMIAQVQVDSEMLVTTTGIEFSQPQILKDFKEFCMDGDFADQVTWINETPQQTKFMFSCVQDTEPKWRKERFFIFKTNQNQQLKIADMVVIEPQVSPKVSPLALAPGPKVGVKQVYAITIMMMVAERIGDRQIKNDFSGGGYYHDKLSHHRMSLHLGVIGAVVAYTLFDLTPVESAVAGGLLSWFLGFGREVKQGIFHGSPNGEWGDVRANSWGSAFSGLCVTMAFQFK